MSIKNLSKETVRIISSGQVITSITSVIKELVENSIDAKATSIECKLVGGGFTSIVVKDNGIGIPLNDRQYIGNRHCTSKLPDGSFDNISASVSTTVITCESIKKKTTKAIPKEI